MLHLSSSANELWQVALDTLAKRIVESISSTNKTVYGHFNISITIISSTTKISRRIGFFLQILNLCKWIILINERVTVDDVNLNMGRFYTHWINWMSSILMKLCIKRTIKYKYIFEASNKNEKKKETFSVLSKLNEKIVI